MQGGSSTPGLFSSPLSLMTKGERKSPTTRLSLHEESATIVLCSGEVSSLLDVHSGRSDSSCSPHSLGLKRPGTHSWVPGPGEPSREDPTDTPHHFTYGSCPSTRLESQPHSESEGMEQERPVPSQHCCVPSFWLGLGPERPGDSEVVPLLVLVC